MTRYVVTVVAKVVYVLRMRCDAVSHVLHHPFLNLDGDTAAVKSTCTEQARREF